VAVYVNIQKRGSTVKVKDSPDTGDAEMRKLLLVAIVFQAIPAASIAAPICVSDSLTGYKALGGTGCELGGATFLDFSSAPSFFGGDEISADDITVIPMVTPLGPRLDMAMAVAAGANVVAGAVIGYSATGLAFTGATLSMDGADAGPLDGVVTALQDICLDGSFAAGDPTTCSGTPDTLIVAQDFVGPTGPDARVFAAAFIDVLLDITIDGGLLGSASLDGVVTNQFSAPPVAVPEPTTFVLLGSGVLGTWLRRRRRPIPR
jgi:hypothetical protein